MSLLPAACLLWAATATPASPPRGTLEEAHIQIAVRGDTAWVIAWYRFAGTPAELCLNAIRPGRQELIFQGVAGAAVYHLDTLPGALRLMSRQADSTPGLDVRYRVVGDLARIPLFVPEAPTAPGRSDVAIRADGIPAHRVARYPFPRFRMESAGTWLATPAHLPAFIALVATPATLPVPALAQWSIVLLVLAGSGAWLAVQVHGRRQARRSQ